MRLSDGDHRIKLSNLISYSTLIYITRRKAQLSPRVNDGDCRTHLPGTGREVTHFPLYVFSPTARITAAGRRFGSSGDDSATVRIGSRKRMCEPGFKSEFETTALEPAVWSFVRDSAGTVERGV